MNNIERQKPNIETAAIDETEVVIESLKWEQAKLDKLLETIPREAETSSNIILAKANEIIASLHAYFDLNPDIGKKVYREGGFLDRIQQIKNKIKNIVDGVSQEILDYEIDGIIREATFLHKKPEDIPGKYKNIEINQKHISQYSRDEMEEGILNFTSDKLKNIIQNLSEEEIRRHPQLIEMAKNNLHSILSDILRQPNNAYSISSNSKYIYQYKDFFQSKPVIFDELWKDPTIAQLQKDIFKNYLGGEGGAVNFISDRSSSNPQENIHRVIDILHIDTAQAKQLSMEILKEQGRLLREDGDNVCYYIGNKNDKYIIDTINLDQDELFKIALSRIKMAVFNPGGSQKRDIIESLGEDLNLSDEDRKIFIERNKEDLKDIIYTGLINPEGERSRYRVSINGDIERYNLQFPGLDLTIEELKIKYTESSELQAAVIEGIAKGLVDGSYEGTNYVLKIQEELSIPLERIQSPEIQKAAIEGIIILLRTGQSYEVKEIRDKFGVSVDLLKSEERVQKAAIEGIIILLRTGKGDAAKEIRDGFGASEEKFQEIKTRLEERKKSIEMAGDFSEMIDNNFLDLLYTEEQESNLDSNEKREIISYLSDFMRKNHFRDKGRTIITLMMAKEGGKISTEEPLAIWEVLEKVKVQIEQYESIIQQGYSNNVPSGIRTSIGMEYEVTGGVAQEYSNQNYSSYKDDVELLSQYAYIGQGADAHHEFAFQPTDNPYLVILELKLLQDLGFIDLNFNEYTKAARGYHITLGGEVGMSPEVHTYFLQSMLSCSNFLGINAGKNVARIKGIYEQGNDHNHRSLFSSELKPMAEFKSFSCDKFEMFERAILTSHNATVAIQAVNKYTKIDSFEEIDQLRPNFPQNSELFYSQLQTSGLLKEEIKNLRIREIIFSWFQLQVESLNLIEDHNQNFLDNETIGYFDENNDWVEAEDFAKRNNRLEFENYLNRVNKIRGKQNQRPYSNLEEYFQELQVSP